ncbi:hypothetical protein GGI11_003391 [Coemansia sp. RSA 2049]|nr:hypothetical protein GGI11_003391 [Coemansia sp. RSA 2049]KAJ2520270.1 hypothetical protein H4217_002160 [Coemansia sp. RSA 1939]KAJ2609968.1 hypothetical protein EV177_004202 [Coemansia sp. RSA 1804]KAJ2681776.1 hypothetical protein GGH99_005039 [Coemansia sp. RSA 1285]
MRTAISEATRLDGISLLMSGHTIREVGSELGVSSSTVSRWRQQSAARMPLRRTGGRPRKLGKRDDTLIARLATREPDGNAAAIQRRLACSDLAGVDVSRNTVAQSLRNSGLRPYVKKRRPGRPPAGSIAGKKRRRRVAGGAKKHRRRREYGWEWD